VFGHQSINEGPNPYVYEIETSKRDYSRKNIMEAKRLLKEAGYPNGIDPKTKHSLILYLDTTVSAGADSAAQMAWIRKQFEKIGIELVIRGTQYSRFQDKIRSGNFQIFSLGWVADYPDPENFLFLFYSKNGKVKFDGENITNYDNPEFDKLFEKMRLLRDSEERKLIISQMTEILRRDSPWIGGYHPKLFALRHQWVGPVKPNEISRNTIKYISLDPIERHKYQKKWNAPLLWPLWYLLLISILLFLPAIYSYWKKVHQPKKLLPPKNLKE
jgi:ABC-type transport system substrate-binding protein